MKKFCFRSIVALFMVLFSGTVSASHVSGVDITYNCLGNNQYEIFLTLYRDCTGISVAGSESVDFVSDCGQTFSFTLDSLPVAQWPNPATTNEISQLCPSQLPLSACNGGTLPGMEMYIYSAVVTLAPPCDGWTVSWSTCCRNDSQNVPTSNADNIYAEAELNTVTAPCNNSPVFTAQPIPYVCVGQPVVYNYGVYDPDGDSLVFSLVSAAESATLNLVYGAGFSGASPIAGITVDPQTGQISFTPTAIGNYIVVILVEEYDSNGVLIGTVMRDMQFTVITCTNNVPAPPPAISNFSGTAVQIGPLNIEMCVGNNFCIDLVFTDPNATDQLTLTSNVLQALPGATFVTSGTNPATATICWTALGQTASQVAFTVTAEDDACPVTGLTQQTVSIEIIPSTYVGPDQTICGSQQAPLNAIGGNIFNWSVIAGDPIVVGTNFTCNPCQSPVASPAVTTTYVVTSNLTGACVNTDTVTINVVPDYNFNVAQSSLNTCLLEPVQLEIQPNPAAPGYTAVWSPATFLSSANVLNPTMTATAAGNWGYQVTVTSPQGCIKVDSAYILAAPAYSPNITALISDTLIQCMDTMFLDIDFGSIIPQSCGLSQSGCAGPQSQIIVGTGLNASLGNNYPSPYGNYYESAHHQILYLASELTAAGFTGGQITDIGFNVANIPPTAATTYNNFEIKIGCTNLTQLTTAGGWVSGLNTVFPSQSVTMALGWNTHTFTDVYDWDGVSNIVIDVCFDMTPSNSTSFNLLTYYTTTASPSVLWYRSNTASACAGNTPNQSQSRPNTRFGICGGTPSPGQFTIQWTPSTFLNDPTISNPFGQPLIPMTYSVLVTNNQGGCQDSASVSLFVNCGLCFPPWPEVHNVTCNGGSDGWVAAEPFGIEGPPWTFRWYDASNTLLRTTVTNSNDTLSGLSAGTYTIQLQDTTGCWDDTTIVITEPPPININTSDTTICVSTSAVLQGNPTGGNGGYTLTWNQGLVGNGPHTVSPTAATNYIVFATDSLGCVSQPDTATVDLYPLLQVTASAPDSVCEFAPALLTAVASGGQGGQYTYSWTGNGSSVGQGASLTTTPTSPQTQYIVQLSDACGSPNVFDTVIVDWYLAPNVMFSGDPLEQCYPISVNFSNDTDPADVGSLCEWDFGDGSTATGCAGVSHTYTSPGCYDVTLRVYSPEGCPGDTTYVDYVCARPYPVADFVFTPPTTNIFATTIAFTNYSVGGTQYQWIFGDNGDVDTSTDANPVIVFPNDQPGQYPVWLYTTNEFGCVDSMLQTVIIDGVFLFYVPNSFTPNGDGNNETFGPTGEGVSDKNFTFTIFDRWGAIAFETTELGKNWDGKINGTEAMTGVYAWRIQVADLYTTTRKEYFGHVTLLR